MPCHIGTALQFNPVVSHACAPRVSSLYSKTCCMYWLFTKLFATVRLQAWMQLGLGPFTDMTLAEFSARQTGVDEAGLAAMERNEVFLDDVSYPSSVDWVSRGAVTTPRQQGQCGSCWAFATVATIESANQIYTGQLLDLSEQELVDCDSGNHGCNGEQSVPCTTRTISCLPFAADRHSSWSSM